MDEVTTRLCECGCGEPTSVSRSTRRGYVKGQQVRFIRGHFSRTAAATSPPVHYGPDNHRWRADVHVQEIKDHAYATVHKYVQLHHPKAGACEQCGSGQQTDYALIHGRSYSRNRADYLELCRLCHNRYDKPWDSLDRDPATGRWLPGERR